MRAWIMLSYQEARKLSKTLSNISGRLKSQTRKYRWSRKGREGNVEESSVQVFVL